MNLITDFMIKMYLKKFKIFFLAIFNFDFEYILAEHTPMSDLFPVRYAPRDSRRTAN